MADCAGSNIHSDLARGGAVNPDVLDGERYAKVSTHGCFHKAPSGFESEYCTAGRQYGVAILIIDPSILRELT
jgi:hypothetical protein